MTIHFNGWYILDNVYVHQIVIFVRTYREQIMFILSQQIKYSKQKLHLIYVIIKKMFVVYFGYLFRYCVIIYLLKYWPTVAVYNTWFFFEEIYQRYYMIEVQLHDQVHDLCAHKMIYCLQLLPRTINQDECSVINLSKYKIWDQKTHRTWLQHILVFLCLMYRDCRWNGCIENYANY